MRNTNQIILESAIINDDEIEIASANTVFVSEYAIKCTAEQVLSEYNEMIASAKLAGVKIVYRNGTKKTLTGKLELFNSAASTYSAIYQSLKTLCADKVRAGIFSPTVDDPELDKIYALSNHLRSMLYVGQPLDELLSIQRTIKEISQAMANKEPSTVSMKIFV